MVGLNSVPSLCRRSVGGFEQVNTKMHSLAVVLVALGLAGVANGNTVIVGADVNNPPDLVSSISNFKVDGADMAALGLNVVVHFSNGTNSGPIAWTAICGASCGQATGVAGNGTWTLTETGDTGSVSDLFNPDTSGINAWTLTNTSTNLAITSVDLLGGNNLIFDRDNHLTNPTDSVQLGTPGSSLGIDYSFSSESGANSPFTVTVTYSNIVTLAGAAQACQGAGYAGKDTSTGCGDVWGNLTFAFTAGGPFLNVGAANAVWAFFQDTDTPAPEPLTMGLTGIGLLALAVYRKRRGARLAN